jgi:hypothetical protein
MSRLTSPVFVVLIGPAPFFEAPFDIGPPKPGVYLWEADKAVRDVAREIKARKWPIIELDCRAANLTSAALEMIAKLCPHLRSVKLFASGSKLGNAGSFSRASDFLSVVIVLRTAFDLLCAKLPDIESLEIISSGNITDAGIQQILANLNCIRSLNLWGASSISEKSLKLIARNHPFIKRLILSSNQIKEERYDATLTCKLDADVDVALLMGIAV